MPTRLTKLEVLNLALDVIREPAAQSLDTSSASMRFLQRNYDHVVDMLLQAYVWNFAKQRFVLNRDGTDPAWGWRHRYRIPANALRVLPLTEGGNRDGNILRHEIVGDYVETDAGAPLRVTCIMRVDNPGEWSPLFAEMVRAQLALLMANKFTGKARFIDIANSLLQAARERAEMIDAIEGSADPIEQHDILRVRET